jgi:nitric oxide reductase NorQ protein
VSVEVLKPEEYFIREEPYYEAVGDEIGVFEAAYHNQLPCLLKGPTGCGKTRFMEHMAWRLKRPLITVSGDLIQPRLPKCAQGPQAEHPPAFCRP